MVSKGGSPEERSRDLPQRLAELTIVEDRVPAGGSVLLTRLLSHTDTLEFSEIYYPYLNSRGSLVVEDNLAELKIKFNPDRLDPGEPTYILNNDSGVWSGDIDTSYIRLSTVRSTGIPYYAVATEASNGNTKTISNIVNIFRIPNNTTFSFEVFLELVSRTNNTNNIITLEWELLDSNENPLTTPRTGSITGPTNIGIPTPLRGNIIKNSNAARRFEIRLKVEPTSNGSVIGAIGKIKVINDSTLTDINERAVAGFCIATI